MDLINEWQQLTQQQRQQLLERPYNFEESSVKQRVEKILQAVKAEGDQALRKFTIKFDGVPLTEIAIDDDEINHAMSIIPKKNLQAMQFAAQQIAAVHETQRHHTRTIETIPGVFYQRMMRPIEKVGFYIPGGTAPLVSTVLMLGVPAKIAGCQQRILCTPPDKCGEINPAILVAAKLCDIDYIYKCGGAQAIAAMAYGTATIPRVNKIFGPGNRFVTEAKKQVLQESSISCDLPAGPSELCVIADDAANPKIVAADLLSQAEHSDDAQVLLIATSRDLLTQTQKYIEEQKKYLSRQPILNISLKNARFILATDINEACIICNEYGPEHLILHVESAEQYLPLIVHAGTIFVGAYSAETLGDYVTGSNHVLPTGGYVRSCSGLSINDFMKYISVQTVTREGFVSLASHAEILATMESLDAHCNAIKIRREEL